MTPSPSPSSPHRLRVALVDDDPNLRRTLAIGIELAGHTAFAFADAESLLAADLAGFDVVVTDLSMPGCDGIELTRRLKERRPHLPIVLLTAHGTIERAVQAVRDGAYEFLQKPVATDHLLLILEKAAQRAGLEDEVDRLRVELGRSHRILGASPPMLALLAQIDRVARTTTTVLVTGETGVGKELVARRLHALSNAAAGPFLAINCAAIPADLIESELFGHRRGAFTGAVSDHLGVFQRADGGTLFLDEIGDLPLAAQVKLLRVLEDHHVTPLGDTRSVEVHVRLVAATNADLDAGIAAGRFRQDLYYRVAVFPLHVPPLRERGEDIEIIARDRLQGRNIDPQAMSCLRAYDWPGNVRELLNVIERALILAGADTPQARAVTVEDLPESVREPRHALTADYGFRLPPEGIDFFALEKSLLQEALARSDGNQAAAARLLGLTRSTLLYRLEKFGLR